MKIPNLSNRWTVRMALTGYELAMETYLKRGGKKYVLTPSAPYSPFASPPPLISRNLVTRLISLPQGCQAYDEGEHLIEAADGQAIKYGFLARRDKGGDVPTILLVPGLACTHGFFDIGEDSLIRALSETGAHVALFDPRGMGFNHQPGLDCTFDTLADLDLPAVVASISYSLASGKPIIVLGHSMGGMLAEFMVVYQANQLNILSKKIARRCGLPRFNTTGMTRQEIKTFLDGIETKDPELLAFIAKAKAILSLLMSIKGIITLGSPKLFDKDAHLILPLLLMLNVILPIMKADEVPLDMYKKIAQYFTPAKMFPLMLIAPDNVREPDFFSEELLLKGVRNFPLGVGAQMSRSVYSGKGFRRAGSGGFNYSAHLASVPSDLPIFHVIGGHEPLAPSFNLGFIDPDYAEGVFDPSGFTSYGHGQKRVDVVRSMRQVVDLSFRSDPRQVRGFLIPDVGHLDMFYGRHGRVTRTLILRLIKTIEGLNVL